MFNIFYNVGRNASHALFDPQPMYCICWNKLLIRNLLSFFHFNDLGKNSNVKIGREMEKVISILLKIYYCMEIMFYLKENDIKVHFAMSSILFTLRPQYFSV